MQNATAIDYRLLPKEWHPREPMPRLSMDAGAEMYGRGQAIWQSEDRHTIEDMPAITAPRYQPVPRPLANTVRRSPDDPIRLTDEDVARHAALRIAADCGTDDQKEITTLIDAISRALKQLPKQTRDYLRIGSVFASRLPRQEQEDFLQQVTLTMLEANPESKLAYAMCRCDYKDYWRALYRHNQYLGDSLDYETEAREVDETEANQLDNIQRLAAHVVAASRGAESLPEDVLADARQQIASEATAKRAKLSHKITLQQADLLVGECDFEQRMVDSLEARRVWQKLPATVQAIAHKRLSGTALTGAERVALHRYVKANPLAIL